MDLKLYTTPGCPYCHEYSFVKWRINGRLGIGSKLHTLDLFIDPRQDVPKRMLGETIYPLLTVVKRKVKRLFFSSIIKHEHTNTIYSAADSYSNFIFLKNITRRRR